MKLRARKRPNVGFQAPCSRPLAPWISFSRPFSLSPCLASSGTFKRSDFGSQPFTSTYEAGQPTAGPLGGASNIGAPKITPRMLKSHLDEYVVGQERAKKVLSTAVYNHYQRIRELKRQEEEYEEYLAQNARREMSWSRHAVQDEAPGHETASAIPVHNQAPHPPPPSPPSLEKSNILLLGPSGVGKTLLARTLAQVLDVPFSMSDCTPLTQAGYIGEDAEVVIQRLLAAANYDVEKAESGIVVLDEIDKIVCRGVPGTGRDVGGEGVQQALLKIVEGTKVQVMSRGERGAGPASTGSQGKQGPDRSQQQQNSGVPPAPGGFQFQGGPNAGGPSQGPAKNEVFTVRTDHILFICTGAFIGLHKLVLERISKGSMGFNAPVSAAKPNSATGTHDTTVTIDSSNLSLFEEHIPHLLTPPPSRYTHPSDPFAPNASSPSNSPQKINTLDLIQPSDLQKFGLIPELIGRLPVTCAVAPLSESALMRVLTEPRNALLRQYEALFALSGIEMRFTRGAVREVARRAGGMGTGARALRGVLEGVLGECMFDSPGSSTKYILINAAVVKGLQAPIQLSRGQGQLYQSLIRQEEEMEREVDDQQQREREGDSPEASSFQEYRKRATVAGI